VARLTDAAPVAATVPREVAALRGVRPVDVADVPEAAVLLADAGLRVTTMGRDVAQDPLFFSAAAAAGALAADLVDAPEGPAGRDRPAGDRPVH
jgi:hypothetical protein